VTDIRQLPSLPKGWFWTQIRDISETTSGGTPSRKDKNFFSGEIPWLKSGELADNLNINSAEEAINQQALDNSSAKIIPKGSLLVALYGATVGKLGLLAIDAAINQAICAIQPYQGVYPKYLFYYISSYRKNFLNARKGGAQPNISQEIVKTALVPLAPAAEQLRIICKVEELFSFLDAGVDSLRKVQAQLKRYRQAVLKYAFEGKLTEEWRKTHIDKTDNAKQQLERIIAERQQIWNQENRGKYKQPLPPDLTKLPELPFKWVWTTVDQLSIVVRGASPRPAGHRRFFGGAIPWITVGPLTADEQPYLQNVAQTVTEAGCRASRYIEPHTLLLTNSGATLGVPKITLIGGCINDGVVALLHVNYPLKIYLYYYFKAQTKRLRNINQGAAQPNLNTGIIKTICVPFPPLNEQKQIVTEIQSAFTRAEIVEANITKALIASERLRAVILAKAFKGELVPQDPNDEPAEKLLECIKAEKGRPLPKGSTDSKNKTSKIDKQVELSRYVK
jgi:type I restriction enzyme S subunit